MNDFNFTDCVKQKNGKWICWDFEKKCFIELSAKEIEADKCEPCALKELFVKVSGVNGV